MNETGNDENEKLARFKAMLKESIGTDQSDIAGIARGLNHSMKSVIRDFQREADIKNGKPVKEHRETGGTITIPASIFYGVDIDDEMVKATKMHDQALERLGDPDGDDMEKATFRYMSIVLHIFKRRFEKKLKPTYTRKKYPYKRRTREESGDNTPAGEGSSERRTKRAKRAVK